MINKEKIPLYLITGFLGSGKTTLLMRLLAAHACGKRVAVVQNDFAGANVDGITLQNSGYKISMLEMNNGSVFCLCQMSNFIDGLETLIHNEHPDVIFIEASGLADPVALSQILCNERLSPYLVHLHTWCVVDGKNFPKHECLMAVRHQIAVADTILVNKSNDTNTAEIRQKIKELNPFGNIVFTEYSNIDTVLPEATIRTALNEPPHTRPDVNTVVLTTTKPLSKVNVMAFLSDYARFCWRMKGFVKCTDGISYAIQVSYQDITMIPVLDKNFQVLLILIGKSLNAQAIRNHFDNQCVGGNKWKTSFLFNN